MWADFGCMNARLHGWWSYVRYGDTPGFMVSRTEVGMGGYSHGVVYSFPCQPRKADLI